MGEHSFLFSPLIAQHMVFMLVASLLDCTDVADKVYLFNEAFQFNVDLLGVYD